MPDVTEATGETERWAGLVAIPGLPTTHASAGHEDRARELQDLARDAHAYLGEVLGNGFSPTLVVAAPDDWADNEDGAPYGIPYASETELVVVIPATAEDNPLVDTYARVASREDAARFADLIAVHELGHLHVRETGLDLPLGWLGELTATYLSYCFLAAHRPADAALWVRVSRDHAAAVTPAYRSLEDLDEIYFDVGPENYIWYQDTLTAMVEEVHAARGPAFVLRLRDAGLTPASDTATTLAAAEAIHPGFERWAETLRR